MATDVRELCQQIKALIEQADLTGPPLFEYTNSQLSNDKLTQHYLLLWNEIATGIEQGNKQKAYFSMGALLSMWMELQNRLPEDPDES